MPGFAGLSTTPSDEQGSPQGATTGGFAGLASASPAGNPIAEGVHNLERSASQMAGNVGRFLREGTVSNASALSQTLDYQRSRSQEAIFHKGSSDANRAALRQAIPGFAAGYNDDTLGGSGDGKGLRIPSMLQHAIRGTEDFAIDTLSDPLTYETLGMGPLLKGGAKLAKTIERGLTDVSRGPEHANLVRFENNSKTSRGGKFYSHDSPNQPAAVKDRYKNPEGTIGGMKEVRRIAKPRNAWDSGYGPDEGTPVWEYLSQHLGQDNPFTEQLFGYDSPLRSKQREDFASRFLRHVGVSNNELNKALTHARKSYPEIGDKGYGHFVLDRAAAQLAKKNGHDAITSYDEFFAVDPKSTQKVYPKPIRDAAKNVLNIPNSSVGKTVRAATNLARENFSLGGRKIEELRRTHGQQAKDNVLGAMTHADAEGHHVKTLLQQRLDKAFKALDHDQRAEVLKILNGESAMPKSGPIADAARSVRKTTDDQLYMQLTKKSRKVFPLARKGTANESISQRLSKPAGSNPERVMLDPAAKAVKRVKKPGIINPESFEALSTERVGRGVRAKVGNLPEKKYNLPDNLKEFASVPGEATLKDFRRKYVSGLSMAEEGEPVDRDAFTSNPLNYQNPNLLARQDFKVDGSDPGKYIDALSRSADNASRNVGASRLHAKLTAAFGDNIPREAVDALEKTIHATGERRSNKEVVLDFIRGATNYGKAATTQFSPMHAANVMALSLLHNPLGTHKVLGTAAKLIKNRGNAEKTYEILRPGIERGAIGPAKDHELKFGKVPGLGQWSKLMSDITWGVDNAAKTEYSKSLGKGYSAGRRASEDLIDYRYPSDFSRNIFSLASRFPTYRSQLMPAVLKGVARNPARAAALMRASGGALTGDEVDVGGHKLKSFTSVADVGRGIGDPAGFARSSLGDLQKAALTFAGISHGRNPKYFTDGQDLNLKYISNALASGVPEGRVILDAMGLGLFPGNNVQQDLIFSLTGTKVQ